MFNLHFKQFKLSSNSKLGDIDDQTVFKYYQDNNEIWGEYSGGHVQSGKIIGRKTTENGIEFQYEHVNDVGQRKTGMCRTEISFSREGKLILNEYRMRNDEKKSSGNSILLEV